MKSCILKQLKIFTTKKDLDFRFYCYYLLFTMFCSKEVGSSHNFAEFTEESILAKVVVVDHLKGK